ncbi:MAG TPA: hypothetical protein VEQ60_02450, partial [Longimicrobium sp.]|nr:hypothetical protein [Longimicrobium sp.]
GGTTWSTVRTGSETLVRVWGNDSTVLAVGWTPDVGVILRSTDDGLSWVPVFNGAGFLSVIWGEGSTILVGGGGGVILRSTDWGETWVQVAIPMTSSLLDAWGVGNTVIATGGFGTVIRSTDLGATWHMLHSGVEHSPFGIWMPDAQNAVLVGEGGLVMRGTR